MLRLAISLIASWIPWLVDKSNPLNKEHLRADIWLFDDSIIASVRMLSREHAISRSLVRPEDAKQRTGVSCDRANSPKPQTCQAGG
jgi:hypothetical protein